MLIDPSKTWTLKELAKEVDVSLGYAHKVVFTLNEMGYMERNKDNRIVLIDPLRLLRRWAAYYDYTSMNKFLDYYIFEREIDGFLEKLKGVKYALTRPREWRRSSK